MTPEEITVGIIAYTTDYVDEGDYRDKFLEGMVGAYALPYFPEGTDEQLSALWNELRENVQDNLSEYLREAKETLPHEVKETLFHICFDLVAEDKSIETANDEWLNELMNHLSIDQTYFKNLCNNHLNLTQPSFKKYFNQKHGFSIELPDTWEIQEDPQEYLLFQAMTPRVGLTDVFQENINLTGEPANNFNLEDYYNASVMSIKQALGDFEINETGNIVVDGVPANYLIKTVEHNQYGYFKQLTVIFVKNNSGYTINCTTHPAYMNQFRDFFGQIISSLKIYGI